MPKIESNTANSFLIDGVCYEKNSLFIVPVSNDVIIMKLKYTGQDVIKASLSSWTDNTDSGFATLSDFVTYIEPFIYS